MLLRSKQIFHDLDSRNFSNGSGSCKFVFKLNQNLPKFLPKNQSVFKAWIEAVFQIRIQVLSPNWIRTWWFKIWKLFYVCTCFWTFLHGSGSGFLVNPDPDSGKKQCFELILFWIRIGLFFWVRIQKSGSDPENPDQFPWKQRQKTVGTSRTKFVFHIYR